MSITVEHTGIVREAGPSAVKVSITPQSSCSGCKAKGSCSLGGSNEKIIEVRPTPGERFAAGEQIKVVLEQSLGMKALGLGYLVPLLLVLAILGLLTALEVNEGRAGMISLAALAPYYLILGLFRNKLKKEFAFRLKKCNDITI